MLKPYAICLGVFLCSEAFGAPPPSITNFRYDEDYSYLKDDSLRTGAWWERLKYVPLTSSGDVYLTFGSELRFRYELLRNDNFGEGPQDDDGYLWARALPVVDLHAGEHVRVFTQFISAFAIDREPTKRAVDENRADVLQAFGDLRLPFSASDGHATLRGGRQMLRYGSERLISNRYGPNVLQAFDGVVAFTEYSNLRLDAFWMRPVESKLGEFDDVSDDTRSLWSLYATGYFEEKKESGVDAYYIGYANEHAAFNQGVGDEERHTFGSRLFGTAGKWDWNVEGFYQFGTFGPGDISAWSVGTDTGYTFGNLPGTPRASLKANIISGDEDPDDVDLQAFNPLFPKGKYFGEIGLLGPYNLVNLHPSIEFDLNERWSVAGATVFYWRESTRDGIYDNAGNLVRPDGNTGERYIGTQMEVLINFHPSRTLEFEASLSRFEAGDFIRATGESKDAYFASVEMRFVF